MELCPILCNLVPRAFPDMKVIKDQCLSQPVGLCYWLPIRDWSINGTLIRTSVASNYDKTKRKWDKICKISDTSRKLTFLPSYRSKVGLSGISVPVSTAWISSVMLTGRFLETRFLVMTRTKYNKCLGSVHFGWFSKFTWDEVWKIDSSSNVLTLPACWRIWLRHGTT